MSYITAIGTANPPHRFSQSTIADFMVRAMQLGPDDMRRLRTIFKASGIEYRYSVLEDYGKAGDYSFYPNTPDFEPFPTTQKRLEAFRAHALHLSLQAVDNLRSSYNGLDTESITHLIVVCCTGMYAPGLDIELVQRLNLSSTVQRICITFMGCYAAFNAMKVADAICRADGESKVLIVCAELCSLHFQKQPTEDNLLANALFADGAAAVMVEPSAHGRNAMKFENFHNDLAPEGEQDMAWIIGDLGFEMKLSAYVPDIIKGGIKKLTDALLQKIDKKIADIKYFVIHPGGRKILETIEQQLNINKERNNAAYTVLRNFGNMSSPTVLFVLQEVFKAIQREDDGAHVLSFAFGPGLTMESMLLKIETDSHA